MNLVMAMLDAPLCGLATRERKRPRTVHAVTMEAVCKGWKGGKRPRFVAACGAAGIALLGGRYHQYENQQLAVLWPPRVKGLPYTRCRACFIATGKQRPRVAFVQPEANAS